MIYQNERTQEISFPLGGIGSGSIGLGGDGRLIDWEIFNHPSKGSRNGFSHIAIKARNQSGSQVRVLNSDLKKDFTGQYRNAVLTGFGHGPDWESMCGFPHFRDLSFRGEFPIAQLTFQEEKFPADVKLTAFNPFIPLDDKNSSIPGAFFEIEVQNRFGETTEFQIAFSVRNPFAVSQNRFSCANGISGIFLKNAGVDGNDPNYGDLTIATDSEITLHQTYWYRGRWKDALVSYWNDFTAESDLAERTYPDNGKNDTCTLVAKVVAEPGETKKARFVLTWNVPNSYNYWSPYLDEEGKHRTWKNYYATVFADSGESAAYALKNWDSLWDRTLAFKNAIFDSTLDEAVIDAVSSNLSVLKSPTVLRLEDGSFYGWEGVHQQKGSCEGTCQHVWNYAYALCFLFPNLERSIRDAEMKYALDETGKTVFRLKLPYERDRGTFRACMDGQMGTVIKMYREWKISGNDEWIRSNWENIQRILEYAWSEQNPDAWDRNRDGVLEGRQHHTFDMELFGPSAFLESMYLAALKAAAKIAAYLGDAEKEKEYLEVFRKGYEWTKENLFNGEYFIQKLDLKDRETLVPFGAEDYWNAEREEIKYQICNGCEIDQMLGQWHADIVGLGGIMDEEQTLSALRSLMKYNYKESLRDHANPWRIYALDDESGTVICEYPEGVAKPAIPIPYCEEVWTGLEYQFAGLLIRHGMVEEGLKVVRSVRARHNGSKRNPWNEFECGSNYARSMSSFALMPIFSGFEFDLPNRYIGFCPITEGTEFRSFWSLGTAWGRFGLQNGVATVQIEEGTLTLSSFGAKFAKEIDRVTVDGTPVAYRFENGVIRFADVKITNKLEIQYR